MTIAEVAGILASKRIGAVLVMDADQLVGIVSERDIVVKLAEHGHRTLEMTASQLMTSEVQTATPRTTVGEAMGMMTDGRFRHVPVIEEGRLVGLVSIGDVVKAKISDAEQEVDSLRAYVAGAA
jgi:CBS domain-containing protein